MFPHLYSHLRTWSCETDLAVPSRVSPFIVSSLRLNLFFTQEIRPVFRHGVNLFIPIIAIGSSRSLSGHAIACRWRSLPRVRRHREVVVPKMVPATGAGFSGIAMDQLLCVSLLPPPLLVQLLLLLFLFLTFSALGANPKNYLTRWPIPLVDCWNKKKRTKRQSLAAHPLPYASSKEEIKQKYNTGSVQQKQLKEQMARMPPRDASTCSNTTQVPVRLAPVQDFFGSLSRPIGVALQVLRFRVRYPFSQYRCLSLLLAMSSRVYLYFPPRGHNPPPILRGGLNPHLCLQRCPLLIPRLAKRAVEMCDSEGIEGGCRNVLSTPATFGDTLYEVITLRRLPTCLPVVS